MEPASSPPIRSEVVPNADKSIGKMSMIAQHGKTFMATISAGMGALTLGATIGYTSPALPNLNSDPNAFHLSIGEIASVTGINSIGAMFGVLIGGWAVDRFGRKTTNIFFALPFVVGWVLIATAKSVQWMYAGRVLTGICSGVMDIAIPVYIVEISHESVRGMMGSCYELSANVGLLFVFALGIVLPWNWLAGACALLPAFMLLSMAFMPESPRFLLSRGRREQCVDVLRWLRGSRADIASEMAAIDENVRSSSSKATWRELGHRDILKPLCIVVALLFCQQSSAAGTIPAYLVMIFDSAGVTWNPYVLTSIVGLVGILSNLLSALIVDKAGRRRMLIVSAIFMLFSMGALAAFFTAVTFETGFDKAQHQWIPPISLMAFNFSVALGYGPVPFYMASELFPLRARGMVGGIAMSTVWIFQFATCFAFPHLIELLDDWIVYWIFTAFVGLGLLFAIFIVPETSGRSLEAIEQDAHIDNE